MVLEFVSALQHTLSLTNALFTATFYSKSFLLFCLYWLCQKATELKHITTILQYLWTLLLSASIILTGSYLDVKYLEDSNHLAYSVSGNGTNFWSNYSFNTGGIMLEWGKKWTALLTFISEKFTSRKPSQTALQILNCWLLNFISASVSFLSPFSHNIWRLRKQYTYCDSFRLFPNRVVIRCSRFLSSSLCLYKV